MSKEKIRNHLLMCDFLSGLNLSAKQFLELEIVKKYGYHGKGWYLVINNKEFLMGYTVDNAIYNIKNRSESIFKGILNIA